jgi:coenzyme PQQ biosynthesis protein PqqD
MDHEAVLVHPGKGEVKVLNELGAEVWKRLDGSRTVDEIVDELIQVYAVGRDQLETDVVRFLDSLHERGLVGLQSADATG